MVGAEAVRRERHSGPTRRAAGAGTPTLGAIGQLKAAVDEAVAGRGCVLLVQVRAGSVRSRALDTLLGHAKRRGVRVLQTRCEPGMPPLTSWARLIPGEDDLPATPAPRPRFARFASMARALEVLARTAPLLVVLEEVHHADRDSLLLLEWLAQLLPAWRLALIATYREPSSSSAQAFSETLGELANDPVCRRFVLDGTGAGAVSERGVFRSVGDYWTIQFEGRLIHLSESKGLRYLAVLLRRPWRPVHVSELEAAASGTPLAKQRGREGKAGAGRARLAVRKSIKAAVARIAASHPELGRHLSASIRYGYSCRYAPDEQRRIEWEG